MRNELPTFAPIPACDRFHIRDLRPPCIVSYQLCDACARPRLTMASRYGPKPTADEVVQDLAPHIRGKTILTTGVSPGGLGATFVEAVAHAAPKLLILAARSTDKAEATARQIAAVAPDVTTRVLRLDLASLKQVRAAAAEVLAYAESIDVLVNNAGVMAGPYRRSDDGVEMQLAANHLGPFLFTNLVMPKLRAAGAGARVVMVSSDGYRLGHVRYYDWNFHVRGPTDPGTEVRSAGQCADRPMHDGESYNQWVAYGQSKTANLLFARALAARLARHGLLAYSLHPGVAKTNLSGGLGLADFEGLTALDRQLGMPIAWDGFDYVSQSQCAATHVVAAFSPDVKGASGVRDQATRDGARAVLGSSGANLFDRLQRELSGEVQRCSAG